MVSELESMIRGEHSKLQTNKIIAWVGKDQKKFDELVRLFLTGDYDVSQRSGWPMSTIVSFHPEMVGKHLKQIVENLEIPGRHVAVKRNTVRLLEYITVPETLQGQVMNMCFKMIEDPKEAIAVKASALTILGNLSGPFPEILPELQMIIRSRWDQETAAFRSRGKKILGKSFS